MEITKFIFSVAKFSFLAALEFIAEWLIKRGLQGVGTYLSKLAFKWQETRRPNLNTPERMLEYFVGGLRDGYRGRLLQACEEPHSGSCLKAQLIFQNLAMSKNLLMLHNATKELKGRYYLGLLKLFRSDCPGLPMMIRSICHCCTLFNIQERLTWRSDVRLKETCDHSMSILDSVLLPLKEQAGYSISSSESFGSIIDAVKTYTEVLQKSQLSWKSSLQRHLQLTIEGVPAIIKADMLRNENEDDKEHVEKEELATGVQAFTQEVPSSFEVLREEDPLLWHSSLDHFLGLAPSGGPGPVASLWQLLMGMDENQDGAFTFLLDLYRAIVEPLCPSQEQSAILTLNPSRREQVAGNFYYFIVQCCRGDEGDHPLWALRISPRVAASIPKDLSSLIQFVREFKGIYEYLGKILARIDHNRDFRTCNRVPISCRCSVINEEEKTIIAGEMRKIGRCGVTMYTDEDPSDEFVTELATGQYQLAFSSPNNEKISVKIKQMFRRDATRPNIDVVGLQLGDNMPEDVYQQFVSQAGGVLV